MKKHENYRISPRNLKNLFDLETAKKANNEGKGYFQAILGVSDKLIEHYYRAAVHLLEKKEYTKAADAFFFLSFLNPFVHNFWIGLGVAHQSMAQFDKALAAYMMGELTDPDNPVTYSNAFQCHQALGHKEDAEHCFQKAMKCCGDKKEWASIKKALEQSFSTVK